MALSEKEWASFGRWMAILAGLSLLCGAFMPWSTWVLTLFQLIIGGLTVYVGIRR